MKTNEYLVAMIAAVTDNKQSQVIWNPVHQRTLVLYRNSKFDDDLCQ